MPTHPDFFTQVRREHSVRRSAYELEAARQVLSGYGCDMSPFTGPTEAEIEAEAERRLAGWLSPEAVLKRELIAAANAGSYEAERIYSAACRGDAGWADRAQAFLAQKAAA